MARRRKQTSVPGQLSLFDIMAGHIESIRAENIQADLQEEKAEQAALAQAQQPSAEGQTPENAHSPVRPYDPEQLLAELKAKRDQVEREALRQRRLPVFDARLDDQIENLERQIEAEREKKAESPVEVLGQSELAQRAREQYAGWRKPRELKPDVLYFIKEGDPDSRYSYHANETPGGGYRLVRSLFNPVVGSLIQVFCDNGQWHITSGVPRGTKYFTYKDTDEAFTAAKEDARERGLIPENAEKQSLSPDEPEPLQTENPASEESFTLAMI